MEPSTKPSGRRSKRPSPLSTLLCLVLAGTAGSLHSQSSLSKPQAREDSSPPESWKLVQLPSVATEFHIPSSFAKRKPSPEEIDTGCRRSFRGRLGGRAIVLDLCVGEEHFTTVSRVLLALSEEATLSWVKARRVGWQPAATVLRQDKESRRWVLALIACPSRQAVALELRFEQEPTELALREGERLLSYFQLMRARDLTRSVEPYGRLTAREIAIGFAKRQRSRVRVLESAHYRLYTDSSAGIKLLYFLEEELLPRMPILVGDLPRTERLERMPIFLHRDRGGYMLAALSRGIPREQAEAMEAHAWDQYYSAWYASPRDPVHIHEGTHQFLTTAAGLDGGGPWIQEGIGHWIETKFIREDPSRVARNLLLSKRLPRLRELIQMNTMLRPRKQREKWTTSELYDVSASIVEFLIENHRMKFPGLLLALGVLPGSQLRLTDAALQQALGFGVQQLDREWRAWLMERRP